MPRRRLAGAASNAKRERDLETVRLVNDALQQDPVRRARSRRCTRVADAVSRSTWRCFGSWQQYGDW